MGDGEERWAVPVEGVGDDTGGWMVETQPLIQQDLDFS